MAASAFDTLKAMRGLEAAGIAPEHAEAITNAVRDAVTEGTATKGDILRVDNDVNTGFTGLNGKVDAHATETRGEIERLHGKIDAHATETRVEIERLNGKIDALATETRADIKQLDGKIDALAKDTKADIARLETRMMMTAIIVAGVVIAAIKYL